jgi:hypothetical protein
VVRVATLSLHTHTHTHARKNRHKKRGLKLLAESPQRNNDDVHDDMTTIIYEPAADYEPLTSPPTSPLAPSIPSMASSLPAPHPATVHTEIYRQFLHRDPECSKKILDKVFVASGATEYGKQSLVNLPTTGRKRRSTPTTASQVITPRSSFRGAQQVYAAQGAYSPVVTPTYSFTPKPQSARRGLHFPRVTSIKKPGFREPTPDFVINCSENPPPSGVSLSY